MGRSRLSIVPAHSRYAGCARCRKLIKQPARGWVLLWYGCREG
jgi:hypothetical protein